MVWMKEYFSIYIDLVMLIIGLYMAFIQGGNLIKDQHFLREGQFCRVVGYIYLAAGIFGIIITTISI